MSIPAVLTIAGSDSGGGAGLQADLRAFTALGCFGTTAITCITAQTPSEVRGVEAVSPDMVADQVRAVCADFSVVAAKTGMLYSAEIVASVAGVVAECQMPNLVIDPVMVATSGGQLMRDAAVDVLCQKLIPQAVLITPNLPEAEVLCGHSISGLDGVRMAARELGDKFGVACALKGGHLDYAGGDDIFDVLWDGFQLHEFRVSRVDVAETHGTGCTFAAAVVAGLAHDFSLADAVAGAQQYVARALANIQRVGEHTPLGNGAA